MFDFLPDAEVFRLDPAPLAQVIAQVRFGSQTVLGTHEGAGAVHDALADMYPRLLAEQQQLVTMTPSGTSASLIPQYRLTDLNKAWSVVLGTEHLTIETSHYSAWTEFRRRLESALRAVTEIATLRIRERVGLRYVNQLNSGEGGSFRGRVRSELLGPAGNEQWESHITSMLGQITAKDTDTQLLLRSGLSAPPAGNTASYLIDIDCFDDQPCNFELDETLAYFDQLNDVTYRCFCWSVPLDYRTQLAAENEVE